MHYSKTHNIIKVRNESERNELLAQVAKRAERAQLLVHTQIDIGHHTDCTLTFKSSVVVDFSLSRLSLQSSSS